MYVDMWLKFTTWQMQRTCMWICDWIYHMRRCRLVDMRWNSPHDRCGQLQQVAGWVTQAHNCHPSISHCRVWLHTPMEAGHLNSWTGKKNKNWWSSKSNLSSGEKRKKKKKKHLKSCFPLATQIFCTLEKQRFGSRQKNRSIVVTWSYFFSCVNDSSLVWRSCVDSMCFARYIGFFAVSESADQLYLVDAKSLSHTAHLYNGDSLPLDLYLFIFTQFRSVFCTEKRKIWGIGDLSVPSWIEIYLWRFFRILLARLGMVLLSFDRTGKQVLTKKWPWVFMKYQ